MKIFNFMLAILFALIVSGCGGESSDNSYETPIAEQAVPNIERSANEIQNTSNTKAYRAVAGETERESIMNHTHILSWAYYTGDNNRWYISTTLGNSSYSDNVYSLMRIKNGRAGWGTVAENAVVIDAENNTLSVDINLDSNSSNSYYDVGWQEWVEDDLIISDRKGIQGKNVIVKWYFFYVEGTGRWYIINTPEYSDGTFILKFASKDGQYDWQETDTADLKPIFFMENGIPKIKWNGNPSTPNVTSDNWLTPKPKWLFTEATPTMVKTQDCCSYGDHDGDDRFAEDWDRSGYGYQHIPIVSSYKGTVVYTRTGIPNAYNKDKKCWEQKDGIGTDYCYGNQVIIDHGNGVFSRYAHLDDNIPVGVEENINAGTIIGYVGNSGNSSSQHLHVVFYKNIGSLEKNKLKDGKYVLKIKNNGPTEYAVKFNWESTQP